MPERWLTFAEVEELLGASSEDVRELMEARTLSGHIVDGVVKFSEEDVRRLVKGGPAKAAEGHFRFLVDEAEEARIEGKAYDGEAFKPPPTAAVPGADEDIFEPMDLSDEQLRNSQLLGGRSLVEFGREVAERSMAEEFSPAELADDEEIIEPSEVDLPEAPFGPLATHVDEARREEPPEPAPPAEQAKVAPKEEPASVFEIEPAPGREPEAAPAERELVAPVFEVESAPTPPAERERKESALEEILFVAEEAKAEAEPPAAAFAAEPEAPSAPEPQAAAAPREEIYEVESPAPLTPVTDGMERAVDEETAEVAPEPVVEAETPAPEAPGETPPPEVTEGKEPDAIEVAEFLAADAPQPPTGAQAAMSPKPPPASLSEPFLSLNAPKMSAKAPNSPLASAGQKSPQPIAPQEVAPPQEPPAPVEPSDRESAAPDAEPPEPDIAEKIDRKPSAEEPKESLPLAPQDDTMSLLQSEPTKPAPMPSEPAPAYKQEAKPVSDSTKKPRPDDKQKAKKSEDIEVFDLETAAPKGEDTFEIIEDEPAEAAPAAPEKEKSLEEEMADLFGDEQKDASPDVAFAQPAAPKVEEDFDLGIFQKDKAAEAAAPAEPAPTDESLFDVDAASGAGAAAAPAPDVDADAGMQGVSRIRAITEERTPASVHLYTAIIIIGFLVLAFTGMLLWHVSQTAKP